MNWFKPRWHPIETAPKDGKDIWIWIEQVGHPVSVFWRNGKWSFYDIATDEIKDVHPNCKISYWIRILPPSQIGKKP